MNTGGPQSFPSDRESQENLAKRLFEAMMENTSSLDSQNTILAVPNPNGKDEERRALTHISAAPDAVLEMIAWKILVRANMLSGPAHCLQELTILVGSMPPRTLRRERSHGSGVRECIANMTRSWSVSKLSRCP
jgi:hypothetical protein